MDLSKYRERKAEEYASRLAAEGGVLYDKTARDYYAGFAACEALLAPLLEAVEKLSKGNRSPGVLAIAREALEAVRKVVEK